MSAQQQATATLERVKAIEEKMEQRLQELEKRLYELERARSCPPGVDPIPKDFSVGPHYPGLG